MRWTPPVSDGGSPITAYAVEKREKGTGRWIKTLEVPAEKCEARVPDLDEGAEYEFRVRAINAAGPGEPSDASKPIIAKPRKCMYYLLNLYSRIPHFILFVYFSGTTY